MVHSVFSPSCLIPCSPGDPAVGIDQDCPRLFSCPLFRECGLGPINDEPCPEICSSSGFTFLEVMVALAIVAITLVAVLGLQSRSLSLANEAKFLTTAPLLAQSKMAEIEAGTLKEPVSASGDFGEDFPGYLWRITVSRISAAGPEDILDHLRQIDVEISWGEDEMYRYDLRL